MGGAASERVGGGAPAGVLTPPRQSRPDLRACGCALGTDLEDGRVCTNVETESAEGLRSSGPPRQRPPDPTPHPPGSLCSAAGPGAGPARSMEDGSASCLKTDRNQAQTSGAPTDVPTRAHAYTHRYTCACTCRPHTLAGTDVHATSHPHACHAPPRVPRTPTRVHKHAQTASHMQCVCTQPRTHKHREQNQAGGTGAGEG